MAKSKGNVEIRFSANTEEFKAAMKSANAAMTGLRGELKLNAAQMKNTGETVEGLTSRQKILQQQEDVLKQKVAAITAQLERSKAEFGENATETNRLTNQLNSAKTAQEKVRTQLSETTAALEKQRSAESQAETAYSKLSSTINEQKTKLSSLQREYANAVIAKGKDSTEAKQLEGKIRSLNDELQQNKAKMSEAESAAQSLASGERELGSAAEKAGDGFTVAKGIVANFAADALQVGIQKTKEIAGDVLTLGKTFEQSLSKVAALSGASADQMNLLETKARELGSSTNFTASQVADAFGYMALAGWDTQQSIDGIAGVLTLAQAGEMDLAAASDLLTDYLSAFGLQASDSAMMADVLAYAQGHANTNTEQLGEAFKNCAANCNAAGMDVQTTTAFISELSNQGLKGSEAGTALTAVMRDMTAKMKDGSIAIGDTAVQVMDANGNYRDMVDVVSDIEAATDGMGDAQKASALQSTFTADSIKGLNLILNAGAGELGSFRDELYGSNDAAQQMADTMTDNLNGDLAEMQSAFEEVGLKIYDKLQEPLRQAVEFVTSTVIPGITWMVENFDSIAPVLAVVAAGVAAFAIALNITGIIQAVTGAVALLGGGLTVLTGPVGIVAAVIAGLAALFVYLWNTNEGFRNAVTEAWNAIMGTIQGIMEQLRPYIEQAWAAIQNAVSAAMDVIGPVVSTVFQAMLAFVVPVLTTLLESVGNIFAVILQTISGVMNGISQVIEGAWLYIQGIFNTIVGLIVGLVTGDFSQMHKGISQIMNGVMSTFAGAWNIIMSVVDGAINTVVQTVGGGLNSAWSIVDGIFNSITSVVGNAMGNARDTVWWAIDAIKGFFNFRISWPHIPLPHLTYSLINVPLLGDIPDPTTIRCDWYANGAVFTRPTMFGINGGRPMVGGEAGPEAILPVSTLIDYVQTAADKAQLRGVGAIVSAIERLADRETVLEIDGKSFARTTASARDSVDGSRQSFADRGLATV